MAQREGKFNLAIAAARVTPVFVARLVLSNDIIIWARFVWPDGLNLWYILPALHKILKSGMRAQQLLWVRSYKNLRRLISAFR